MDVVCCTVARCCRQPTLWCACARQQLAIILSVVSCLICEALPEHCPLCQSKCALLYAASHGGSACTLTSCCLLCSNTSWVMQQDPACLHPPVQDAGLAATGQAVHYIDTFYLHSVSLSVWVEQVLQPWYHLLPLARALQPCTCLQVFRGLLWAAA